MDIAIDYTLTGDLTSLRKKIMPMIMAKVESVVQNTVNAYIVDLERHMGGVHGGSAYADGKVRWDALDETQLKEAPRFWIESGRAKKSVSVNIKMTGNSIHAFAGISEGADGYEEVLWNELGFTPANGDKLIRRPLFFPLAEVHIKELNEAMSSKLAGTNIHVKI